MIGNVIDGKPCLCPHLSYKAPALAWWLRYAPDSSAASTA
jgi:hypothetical protein